ncbi:hypothetical protein Q75_16225 [Bacillus coahuilensis p1.1.43]|uniref:Lipoprotein n=1 Tax=Bacillus coahuilensis p1.1.43 TaxID=1150625 RepID=A0A147K474_9BACI|nr:hypothetical protein [Bacillus coahuilensis]KUP04134.1 hypothetical protein Q75_16225 [Bacillus coahuilensis p1.1.43]
MDKKLLGILGGAALTTALMTGCGMADNDNNLTPEDEGPLNVNYRDDDMRMDMNEEMNFDGRVNQYGDTDMDTDVGERINENINENLFNNDNVNDEMNDNDYDFSELENRYDDGINEMDGQENVNFNTDPAKDRNTPEEDIAEDLKDMRDRDNKDE